MATTGTTQASTPAATRTARTVDPHLAGPWVALLTGTVLVAVGCARGDAGGAFLAAGLVGVAAGWSGLAVRAYGMALAVGATAVLILAVGNPETGAGTVHLDAAGQVMALAAVLAGLGITELVRRSDLVAADHDVDRAAPPASRTVQSHEQLHRTDPNVVVLSSLADRRSPVRAPDSRGHEDHGGRRSA